MNNKFEIVFVINDKLRIIEENNKYYIEEFDPIWYNKNRWSKWTAQVLSLFGPEFILEFDDLFMALLKAEEELNIQILTDEDWKNYERC